MSRNIIIYQKLKKLNTNHLLINKEIVMIKLVILVIIHKRVF
jgi:hypothetical protein